MYRRGIITSIMHPDNPSTEQSQNLKFLDMQCKYCRRFGQRHLGYLDAREGVRKGDMFAGKLWHVVKCVWCGTVDYREVSDEKGH